MHKYQILSMHIKLTKFFSLVLSIHQQRGEGWGQSNNKDVYAIYIHEKERRKVSSHLHALHGEVMTRP